jgi:hypothetical protein
MQQLEREQGLCRYSGSSKDTQIEQLAARLREFYAVHAPEKLCGVDEVATAYCDDVGALDEALLNKYGQSLSVESKANIVATKEILSNVTPEPSKFRVRMPFIPTPSPPPIPVYLPSPSEWDLSEEISKRPHESLQLIPPERPGTIESDHYRRDCRVSSVERFLHPESPLADMNTHSARRRQPLSHTPGGFLIPPETIEGVSTLSWLYV